MKAYCAKYHLRDGFVCYSEGEDELLIMTDGFSEDPHNPGWKVLDDVIVASLGRSISRLG